jgi:hypothetical protein
VDVQGCPATGLMQPPSPAEASCDASLPDPPSESLPVEPDWNDPPQAVAMTTANAVAPMARMTMANRNGRATQPARSISPSFVVS